MNEMKRAIEAMENAKKLLAGEAPVAVAVDPAPVEEVDPITALRRWRLAAGVRYVGKSMHVKGARR